MLHDEHTRCQTTPEICPICSEVNRLGKEGLSDEDREQLRKRIEKHIKIKDTQTTAYLQLKEQVSRGELPILVIQDFSQVLFTPITSLTTLYRSNFRTISFRCLLLSSTLMTPMLWMVSNDDIIALQVLELGTSMMFDLFDLPGLICSKMVWITLPPHHSPRCSSGVFDNCDHITIFSDGGPHHFKVSAAMVCFSQLQEKYGKTIEYNFFAPYHGHSTCDTVAAHVKRFLRSKIRELSVYVDQALKVHYMTYKSD